MDQPVVSVVLITYNHEQYIVHAIESVLAQQTEFPCEILISEDCSTDSTRDILSKYQQRYPEQIQLLLSERNQFDNQVVTRALLAAKGQYVALLEGDDYWTNTNKLQRQVEFLNENQGHAICFHGVRYIYEPGMGKEQEHLRPAATMTLRELLREGNLKFRTCSMVLRNGLLKKYPEWFNRVYCGDWALTLLYAEQGSVGYIDEVMAAYRIHPNGIWSRLGAIERAQRAIEFHETIKGHFSITYSRLMKRALAKAWYGLAAVQYDSGQGICARSSAERGLAEWPFYYRLLLIRYTPWLWSLLKSARDRVRAVWLLRGRNNEF
jgi:glycosyltransferase involved in cell wall biosynthesis